MMVVMATLISVVTYIATYWDLFLVLSMFSICVVRLYIGSVVTMTLPVATELKGHLSIDPVLVSLLINISDTNSQPLANITTMDMDL